MDRRDSRSAKKHETQKACVDGLDELPGSPADTGVVHMHYHAPVNGQAAEQTKAPSDTARRLLQQLFDLDPAVIDESGALADFEGCNLPNVVKPLTPGAWRILVKDRVYSCFGVNCDVDEPLSSLVARIELAEHGVRCTLSH
jgi:hypothetical protein